MRVRALIITSIAAFAFALAGCGGDKPPPETPSGPSPEEVKKEEAKKEEAKKEEDEKKKKEEDEKKKKEEEAKKKVGKEVLEGGGTFMFSLADSADAKKAATEECEKKAKKDDKKKEACLKEVDTAAAGEGIRFEKDPKGAWWFVSFGKEKDKEVVYIKSQFKIATAEKEKVTVTPEGKAEGKMAKNPAPKEMVFEIPDESTVAMTDPKKGKLVFKKK